MAFVQHPAFPDDAPLSVSNPDEWVEQGWVPISEKEAAEVDPTITPKPAGNATRDEWVAYATSKGAPNEETRPVEEGGLKQAELRDKYSK
jgi:hypothetical protein